jgi:hypothetical protein
MARSPCLLVSHPWATLMVLQQQTAHAQLATAAQAQAQVQTAHAQAAHVAAQQAHFQAEVHQVHHHPPHAQPHKQYKIIAEEKLQEKGEAVISLHITVVSQTRSVSFHMLCNSLFIV